MNLQKLALILVFSITCCTSKQKHSRILKPNVFIDYIGTYYTPNKKISIREFKNQSLTFAISDKRNNLLYQYSILKSFSKYQFWTFYWDDQERLWFYNSDSPEHLCILKDSTSKMYKAVDFCSKKMVAPKAFSELMEDYVDCIN